MPENSSASKRHRQSEARRLRNRMTESRVKTVRKQLLAAVQGNDRKAAESHLALVLKLIDSAANKGVFAKNTAARKKSRLHTLFNSMTAPRE